MSNFAGLIVSATRADFPGPGVVLKAQILEVGQILTGRGGVGGLAGGWADALFLTRSPKARLRPNRCVFVIWFLCFRHCLMRRRLWSFALFCQSIHPCNR
jgi:hypothetical protein